MEGPPPFGTLHDSREVFEDMLAHRNARIQLEEEAWEAAKAEAERKAQEAAEGGDAQKHPGNRVRKIPGMDGMTKAEKRAWVRQRLQQRQPEDARV